MKGQVLHHARAHLKVPGWSLVWNELLTKKLPMFLSRLNEMSGGCEKIVREIACSYKVKDNKIYIAKEADTHPFTGKLHGIIHSCPGCEISL